MTDGARRTKVLAGKRKSYRKSMEDPEYRVHRSAQVQRAKARNPEGRRARKKMENAVNSGFLIPAEACEDCSHDFSKRRREAHHESYERDQWLVVVWLCSSCHGKRHREAP